jgi:hypothetical protein
LRIREKSFWGCQQRVGEKEHFEMHQSSLLLPRLPLRRKSVIESNLLGFHQSLSTCGEGNAQL